MEKNVIRIRVDLSELGVPASFRYVWVAVNQTMLNTIQDLKVLLSKKFNLNERNEIQLYCQQCLLPSDETIFILRDEDFVKIVYGDKPSLNVESSYNSDIEITNSVKNSSRYEVVIKDSHKQSSRSRGDYACINKITSKKRLCSDSPDTAPPPKKTLCTSGEKSKIRDDSNRIQKEIFEMDSEEHTSFDQNKMKVKKKRKKHKTEKGNLLHMECKELMDKANEPIEHSFITDSNELDRNLPEKIDKSESKNSYTDNSKDYSQKEVMNREIEPEFQKVFLPDDVSLSSEESSARKEIPENTSTITKQSPIGHSSEYSKTSEINTSQLSGNNCRKRKRRRKRNKKKNLNSAGSIKILPNSVGNVLARLPVNTTAAACNIIISEDAELSEGANLTTKIYGDKIESVQECGRKHIRFIDASDENENIVSSPQTPSTDITNELKQNAVEDNQTNKSPWWMVWGTPVAKVNITLAETNTTSSLLTTCKEQKTVEQGRSLESLTKLLPLNLMPNGVTKASNNNLQTAEVLEQEEIKKPNYIEYPALNTQPSPGDLIAFKVLELSESYCPEVSDYKEGRVKSIDPESDNIELELISEELKQPRIGKFENLYPDETPKAEVIKTVKVRWSSMIEPKLLPS